MYKFINSSSLSIHRVHRRLMFRLRTSVLIKLTATSLPGLRIPSEQCHYLVVWRGEKSAHISTVICSGSRNKRHSVIRNVKPMSVDGNKFELLFDFLLYDHSITAHRYKQDMETLVRTILQLLSSHKDVKCIIFSRKRGEVQ